MTGQVLVPAVAQPVPRPVVTAALVAGGVASAALVVALDGVGSAAGPLLAAALAGVVARRAGPVPALGAVLVAGALQNLVAAGLAPYLDAGGVVALLAAKEAFVGGAAVAGFWLLRGRLPWLAADRACALFLLLVTLAVARQGLDGSMASLAAVRQAVTLPALWLAGRALSPSAAEVPRALGWVLRAGLVVAVFGLLERLVLGDAFWTGLGLSELYEKKGLGSFVAGELPGNFFSWDWGRPVRRLVGTLAEPTSAAHFLAVPVALAIGARGAIGSRRGAALVAAVPAGVALLLTLGKSGIVTAALGAAAGLARRGARARALLVGGGLLGVLAAVAAAGASAGLRRNLVLHTRGLGLLWEDGVTLLGRGFGTAGNFSLALRGDWLPDSFTPTESFVAALATQGGAACAGAYLLFCALAVAALVARREGGAPADARAVLAGVVGATCLASFGSETPAGFLAGGVAFLVAGALAAPPARSPQGEAEKKARLLRAKRGPAIAPRLRRPDCRTRLEAAAGR